MVRIYQPSNCDPKQAPPQTTLRQNVQYIRFYHHYHHSHNYHHDDDNDDDNDDNDDDQKLQNFPDIGRTFEISAGRSKSRLEFRQNK